MVSLQVAVDSTAGVQGANALARELERMGQQAVQSAQKIDQLETYLSDLTKDIDSNKKATAALADENARLQERLRGTSVSFSQASNKAAEFARAAGAVNEISQIGSRISGISLELSRFDNSLKSTGSLLNVFAISLTDIAQVSSKASGTFDGFVGLLRANPLLAAATVITTIATAMKLFGSNTKETNADLEKQISLFETLQQTQQTFSDRARLVDANRRIGIESKPGEAERTTALALRDAALNFQKAGLVPDEQGFIPFSELRKVLADAGISGRDIAAEIVEATGRGGLRFARGIGVSDSLVSREPLGVSQTGVENYLLSLAREQLDAAKSLEAASANLNNAVREGKKDGGTVTDAVSGDVYGPSAPPEFERRRRPFTAAEVEAIRRSRVSPSNAFGQRPDSGLIGPTQEEILRQSEFATQRAINSATVLSPEERKASFEQARDELLELEERVNSLKSLGQDAGQAIGQSFFSIVNGAANARQALAGLLQQFIAIAQQRVIQNFANSLGNAFSANAQQNLSNAQNVAATGPTTAGDFVGR